jgi:CubicO group peptidase (beta-lactamase class C family)
MAAAGLWTTASDLARFAIAVQQGLTGSRNPVLSQSMLKQMVSRQFEDWGLGFGVIGEGEKAAFRHNGVDEGFDTYLFAYAHTGNGIAIMFNANSTTSLSNEILRAVAKEYRWPDYQQEERESIQVDAKTLDGYAGVYQAPRQKLTVTTKDGHLYIAGADGRSVELYASSPVRFFSIFQGNWYEFTPGDNGATTMTISTPDGEMKAPRLP